MANNTEQRSYDTGASQEAQSNFERVASRLEALIGQRDADVKAAMAQYQADGVSEEYRGKEQRWSSAAGEVRGIITTIRTSLQTTDDGAQAAIQRAKQSVDNMG
ncbi:hypothetical protein D4740_09395 [Actinomyces sp. 2119]|uniref:Pore-forming ESAT-6 family protein n=1 Tax=Actinomyces lilanjuaniae TaxID=2321394 RepID=A0ABN5PQT3_9ACTO|nr:MULTISPECIES: pore-forming ESAT-6 family protein [Actinomyces]AYD89015.1 hypothetical protein D5R93_01215 [Actinomyces lilanjuaniae]RJF41131.1 hypothetical protein D4740_09395 [Actinomyces sp. 2119]